MVLLVVFLLYVFLPKVIIGGASLVGRLSTPLFNVVRKEDASPDSWELLFSQKKQLLEENRTLGERLALLESKALLVDTLEAENKALHTKESASSTPLVGHILSRGGMPVYGSVTIDVGTLDGVQKGDMVLSESRYLLGTVIRADMKSSLVLLFSANGVVRDVFVGSKHTLLEAKGVGNGNFVIEAPHEAGIIIGDAVINATGGSYPLGVVERVKYNPADPSEMILFQHPVNIRDIDAVLLMPSV